VKEAAAPSRPGSTGDNRRQDLVRAAMHEIAERGFEGLRTREVARAAGVNIATLHYYFPTKEALIRAVVENVMGRFRSTLAPSGSAGGQLRDHLRAVRRLFREEPEISAVMGEFTLRARRDPQIAGLMAEMNDTWHRLMRGLLRHAVREGRLRPGLDTDEVAALVIATMMSQVVPAMAASNRSDLALRQLERWLGLRGRGSTQATD
jgi:AcrR family transcriptional regulator